MVTRIAQLLIEHRAVEFGSFRLASGSESSYYIDIKTAVTHPSLLAAIAKTISQTEEFDIVAGVAIGGVPLAVAVSLESKKPYAIVRSLEKDHGKKEIVIGNVKDRIVLLVEDVVTSGGSALYGINALRAAGARIDRVVTVVDRDQGAAAMLVKHGVRLVSLVSVRELISG
jgi:orotate phosphoribosyltransferase